MKATIIALIIIILAGVGYVVWHPEVIKTAQENVQATSTTTQSDSRIKEPAITWKFENAPEKDNIPYTLVSVTVNGTAHAVGTYQGSCSEIGASGGIDGKGLLAGELSAAQCWFAGGGDEIGVFANEDGGLDLMVGGLSEGAEGGAGIFRGDFKMQSGVTL